MPRLDGRSAVNERGRELELRTKKHLESIGIPHIYQPNNGIDFIIAEKIHLDCISTGSCGTIDNKIAQKCFDYIHQYSLKDIFILHPYSGIAQNVANFLTNLEVWMDCRIHVIDWADFESLVRNELDITTRSDYKISKHGVRFSIPNTFTFNKFFDWGPVSKTISKL